MPGKSAPVKAVLDTLRTAFGGPRELDEQRPLEQLILLILSEKADIRKARAAMKRLQTEYVDWNEVRVTSAWELRSWLLVLGSRKVSNKAEQLKELLSTVYNRFNKVNLDFLNGEEEDPEESRKRDRFLAYLQERSPAMAAMMAIHRSRRNDPVVRSGLPRVMHRLGWVRGKSATISAGRAALTRQVPETDRIAAQWGLYHVLEEHCHARSPDCPGCPLVKICPTGRAAIRRSSSGSSGRRKARAAGRTAASGRRKTTKKRGRTGRKRTPPRTRGSKARHKR